VLNDAKSVRVEELYGCGDIIAGVRAVIIHNGEPLYGPLLVFDDILDVLVSA
jgi:hypothetical protein